MIPIELEASSRPVATTGNESIRTTCRPTADLRVLFVDDDSFVIAAMRRMLRRLQHSFNFAFCHDAHEALDCLEQQPYDLVISDLQMPGVGGSELLQRIAAEHPSVVRFALSGQSDPNRDTPVSAVAHRFLPKPCEPAQLRAAIEQFGAVRNSLHFAEDLEFCTSLPGLPVGPRAQEAIQHWCQHRHDQEALREIDRDLGASMMVLRLANFAAADPVQSLPSESIATFRGATLLQLRDWSVATWPSLRYDDLQTLRTEFSQSLPLPVPVTEWYRLAGACLPGWLAACQGWPSGSGAEPRWQRCADYLFVLWTGKRVTSWSDR